MKKSRRVTGKNVKVWELKVSKVSKVSMVVCLGLDDLGFSTLFQSLCFFCSVNSPVVLRGSRA